MLSRKQANEFIRILQLIRPRAFPYAMGVIGSSLMEASVYVTLPFVYKRLIDAAIQEDMRSLTSSILMFGIQLAVISVFFIGTSYLYKSNVAKIIRGIRLRLFQHVGQLPASFFDKNHSGDIASSFTNDLYLVNGMIGWNMRAFLLALFTGLSSIAGMFILSWQGAGLILLMSIVFGLVNMVFTTKVRNISDRIQQREADLSESIVDQIAGCEVIRMFQLEEVMLEQTDRINRHLMKERMHNNRITASMESFNFLVGWMNFAGIIAAGAMLVLNGFTQFGTVVAMLNLLAGVNMMIRSVSGLSAEIQVAMAGGKRILDLLHQQPEGTDSSDPADEKMVRDDEHDPVIEMKHVSFHYEALNAPVIRNLSMSVYKGQTVALVGPSGEGKSTLIKLLLGYYLADSGEIKVSRIPIRGSTLGQIREKMAYVPQEPYLFDGTVEENIRMGREDASNEDVREAAKAAHAHDFIMEFPEGYQTALGERGAKLSMGQRQRISIARAILKKSPILLLDEATASLDTHSELIIQESLQQLMKEKTVILIAHRLSTTEHADVIHVIDHGTIQESGTHQQLIALNGIYRSLYESQFESTTRSEEAAICQ
ncbi:ABC transporter ATP-binding protein [Gorillibacterium timonense]|uniref:ABC transporter ATP-binding protein n=1 Tax=Gorillibacterium timonense TaxID=1689269 RepID=UPI00071CCCEF|nr:ABC transporter ATP-binding protein [Gorillibacterium timonense]